MTMAKIKERHADAIERFGKYYSPKFHFGLPHLIIDHQSFALHHDPNEEGENDYREWLGWMLCAALKTLVETETADAIKALQAENERLREALKSQIYHFEQAMNNEDCGPWYEDVQDAKKLIAREGE